MPPFIGTPSRRPVTKDWADRPVATSRLRNPQTSNIRTVQRDHSWTPATGLTPGKLAAILRDSIDGDPEAYLALAEDMEERNEHYAGVLGTRKRQVAGLPVTVEASGESAAEVEQANMIREITERDAFRFELIDMLDATGKGFSCTQICWDTSEGQWLPRELCWWNPRWFDFDRLTRERPQLRGVNGLEELDPFGWIYHQSKTKSGLPIRGGLARAAAWAFLFKSFTLKDWAIFVEAYGHPLRLGKKSPNASEADEAMLMRAVASIGADFAAVIPEGMSIEFIQAAVSGSHELFEKRADWLDRQTSKLVLGQTATTDAIAGGHAVGKTHDEVRGDIEEDDAARLSATLNRDLVMPVVDLNFGKQRKYPKLKIGRPDAIDVKALVENVAKLVPIGLEVAMDDVRDAIGMAAPKAGAVLLRVSNATAAPLLGPDGKPLPPAAAPTGDPKTATASAGRSADAIETMVDDLLSGQWEAVVEPALEPVITGLDVELAAASSTDEARAILNRRLDTLGVAGFTDLLARSAFAARLAGELGEDLS